MAGEAKTMLLAGIGLMTLGLVGWLYAVRLAGLRAWDRPVWSLRPLPRAAFAVLRIVALAVGWILIFLASKGVASVVAAGIMAAWGWTRWIRSASYAARRIRSELERLRAAEPHADDRELLVRIVTARHPEWGPELAERMVADHPTPEGAARILARMESGWSSFGG